MKRKIEEDLKKWSKKKEQRLPILISGARQVGKTYVMKELGRTEFKNYIYMNFEQDPLLQELFQGRISPKDIINNIERYFRQIVTPYETLLIFDEIQICEYALTSLKYFAEEATEYHIIAAGSLLGVALNREHYSFPVGKVQILQMYPLSFEEFLWAKGEEFLASSIREHFITNIPFNEANHVLALQLYLEYIVVGGMPATILASMTKETLIHPFDMQDLILSSYVGDMAKYATHTDTVKIRETYESLPVQLAKENKKFRYALIKRGGRASQYGDCIDWLLQSGIVLQCTRIEQSFMPPSVYRDLTSFKLYFSDVGLLFKKSNMPVSVFQTGEHNLFKGVLIENYVAQSLKANGYELLYWTSNNTAEIDFIIVKDNAVIPIECKSGLHTKSKSLNMYREKYNPRYSIRISMKNFGLVDDIKSVPLYAVHCI